MMITCFELTGLPTGHPHYPTVLRLARVSGDAWNEFHRSAKASVEASLGIKPWLAPVAEPE